MASQAHEITMKNFESTVDGNEMVILDFWAEWCGPCKMFAPVFEEAAKKHEDIFFGKVNTEIAQDLAASFQIRSIPTLMVFKKGELVFEQPGMLPAPVFEELIGKIRELDVEAAKAEAAAQQSE